jgi:peptidyl-prolyl cis-trans isomerase SurA
VTRTFAPLSRLGRALALALAAGLALGGLTAAPAQNLFAPVMQVNNKVITQYDMQQRQLFYTLLNAPGDPEEATRDRLIEEKLQLGAAEAMGIAVTPEQVIAGEEEFAGRVNLDRGTFLKALAQGGVEEQTFRDFVTVGLMWREVLRQRFQPHVRITDADIDNELRAEKPAAGNLRLLYSEIVLPANTPAAKDAALRRAKEIKDYTSFDAFSRAARAFSAAPSRARGGRVDWVEAKNMAPGLLQVLIAMAPGQVTDPLPIPNAIALLQLREIDDGTPPPPEALTVDYSIYLIPGGHSPAALAEAAQVQARVADCGELYAYTRRTKGGDARLEHVTQSMAEVPGDVALELAKLDPGEWSTALTRGGQLALLTLYSRQQPLPEGTDREEIRNRLLNQQIQILAEAYLAELRDSAVIRVP